MAGPNTQYTVDLKERQYEFLQQMVEKYNLPDESKALRCLLDYATENPEVQDDIFETVRCLGC